MKTQIFTLVFGIFAFFSLNSMATEKLTSEKNTDNVPVSSFSLTNEAITVEKDLQIETWMTNDHIWKTNSFSFTDEPVKEEKLQLEKWMTDPEVWNKNYTTTTVFVNKGKAYKIIHSFRTNTIVEEPLAIKRWMINDNLWRM